jgi:DNA-directed RNA polymerase subunit RPC12/RpoP
MILAKYGKTNRKGTWNYSPKGSGMVSVAYICHECGTRLPLDMYEIDWDGDVYPHVVCKCGVKENITLIRWLPNGWLYHKAEDTHGF